MAIPYDQSVLDLVAQLSATGHVTHSRAQKTSVTIHHNGGILTHEEVLNVWRTRPASAHFNVDARGTVAQYVHELEYAWATGSTPGNTHSISIEMCNASGGPSWLVSKTTWRSAARLAGWLFARVIGARPGHHNLKRHSDWSATACPGPFMAGIWDQFVAAAQAAYDAFAGGGTPPSGGGGGAPGGGGETEAPRATDYPLPAGHYFGDVEGPDESHGGYYVKERSWVRQVQEALQARGFAPKTQGWADGIWEQPTTDAMKAWERAAGRPQNGQCDRSDWDALVRGISGPAPAPPPPPSGGAGPFPLPRNEYFGDIAGPNESHGGYYQHERPHIRRIQQALIRKGYVPGVTDPNSGWADGIYERPTVDAVARFQRAEMPGTTRFGEVWWDDWAKLLS